jgi:short-subunit dehydrogenase
MNLGGANAIVTGGSRGIGPVIARALAGRGAKVALAARSEEELEKVRAELEEAGGTAISVPGDVTKAADRKALVERTEAELGPVDVLVNNAGFDHFSSFTDLSAEDIERMLELNLYALILLTREVVPAMLQRKRGHVVNLSSGAGKTMVPYSAVYSATKHAVVGFTLSLRAELHGSGVSASVVAPGYVKGAGMYERDWGSKTPPGTSTTVDKVARAVVKAIEKDVPEIVAAGALVRMSDVALAISPGLTERLGHRTGAFKLLKEEAARRRLDRSG